MGAILMILVGWGDFRNSMADDFPDADLDAILDNYQNQEINITAEEYQDYHDELEMMAHILFEPLIFGGILVLIGGILIQLNLLGQVIACWFNNRPHRRIWRNVDDGPSLIRNASRSHYCY